MSDDQLHHVVVAGNAVGGELRVDRALDGGFAADGHEPRLEERERHLVMRTVVSDLRGVGAGIGLGAHVRHVDQPLALVLFDHAAMLAGQGLELCRIEIAASDHEATRIGRIRRGDRGDHILNVVLDVDPGRPLEFLLPLFVGHPFLEPLAHLRGHDFAHVREGNDARVSGHVAQFGRSSCGTPKATESHHRNKQPAPCRDRRRGLRLSLPGSTAFSWSYEPSRGIIQIGQVKSSGHRSLWCSIPDTL